LDKYPKRADSNSDSWRPKLRYEHIVVQTKNRLNRKKQRLKR
jgi:hypothetical protein